MNKYLVTLSLVVDAINDEHAEELTRQLAPDCGEVAVHHLGQTPALVAEPRVLSDLKRRTEEDGVEIQFKLTRQETELLIDLCALQFETLKNATINEGTTEYQGEMAVLQKLLDTLQNSLEG